MAIDSIVGGLFGMTPESYQDTRQLLEQRQALQQAQQAYEAQEKEKDRLHEITIAEIETFKFVKDQDINSNQVPDAFEVEKFRVQAAQKDRELDIKEAISKKRATSENS